MTALSAHWHWVLLSAGGVMHRVTAYREVRDDDEGLRMLDPDTACGRWHMVAWMPGVGTRLGGPRCARCCDALGIPRGVGSALNAGINDGPAPARRT